MAPKLVHDTQYALTVAALYGCLAGIFVGRAVRLWRLALGTPATTGSPPETRCIEKKDHHGHHRHRLP
ncbi:MAG: hypothetical protein JWP65_1926 [Ramlibacter sp.]|uniref:DUF6622 family protein n=1 Tax=Ramlibacter sp. TaxID=1917967 RepID=UPI0026386FB8|nr:DUF6622 family protein [Ramlibacter sp.]MDB5751505.1 hypothetical protein [Ramlibacter sp.]